NQKIVGESDESARNYRDTIKEYKLNLISLDSRSRLVSKVCGGSLIWLLYGTFHEFYHVLFC
ncbi:MAG: hypothetical protein QXL24_08795, partial [Candidatus Jordarchaeaceae archaeon]